MSNVIYLRTYRRWYVDIAYYDGGAYNRVASYQMADNRIDAERKAKLAISVQFPHLRLCDLVRVRAWMDTPVRQCDHV